MKGRRVSGPSLDSWGGNANALRRPNLYTRVFSIFLPCGTMFPLKFSFAGDMAARWASDAIAMHQSRGRGVHLIDIKCTCKNGDPRSR